VAKRLWRPAEVRALGTVTDVVTAGEILGIGRTKSYQLARSGLFPVPVSRHGRRFVVPVAPMLRILGIEDADRSE